MATSRQRSNWDTTSALLCYYATSKSNKASKTFADYNPFREEKEEVLKLSTKEGIKMLFQALKESR